LLLASINHGLRHACDAACLDRRSTEGVAPPGAEDCKVRRAVCLHMHMDCECLPIGQSFSGSGGARFARDHSLKQDSTDCTRTHAHKHEHTRTRTFPCAAAFSNHSKIGHQPAISLVTKKKMRTRRLRATSRPGQSIAPARTRLLACKCAQIIYGTRVRAELGAIFASLPSPRDQVHAVCLRLVCTQLFGPVSTNREINLERHTFNPRLDFQSQKVAARPLREQRPARLG